MGDGSGKLAMVFAIFLAMAIVGLAYISVFKPGPSGEWKIKVGGLEASGSSVLLGFAVLLFLMFWHVWPNFKTVIFDIQKMLDESATGLFRIFR